MLFGDPPAMTLLAARSLQKSYRSRTVVRDLSLEIHTGEVVGLARTQWRRQDHGLLHDRRFGRRQTAARSCWMIAT